MQGPRQRSKARCACTAKSSHSRMTGEGTSASPTSCGEGSASKARGGKGVSPAHRAGSVFAEVRCGTGITAYGDEGSVNPEPSTPSSGSYRTRSLVSSSRCRAANTSSLRSSSTPGSPSAVVVACTAGSTSIAPSPSARSASSAVAVGRAVAAGGVSAALAGSDAAAEASSSDMGSEGGDWRRRSPDGRMVRTSGVIISFTSSILTNFGDTGNSKTKDSSLSAEAEADPEGVRNGVRAGVCTGVATAPRSSPSVVTVGVRLIRSLIGGCFRETGCAAAPAATVGGASRPRRFATDLTRLGVARRGDGRAETLGDAARVMSVALAASSAAAEASAVLAARRGDAARRSRARRVGELTPAPPLPPVVAAAAVAVTTAAAAAAAPPPTAAALPALPPPRFFLTWLFAEDEVEVSEFGVTGVVVSPPPLPTRRSSGWSREMVCPTGDSLRPASPPDADGSAGVNFCTCRRMRGLVGSTSPSMPGSRHGGEGSRRRDGLACFDLPRSRMRSDRASDSSRPAGRMSGELNAMIWLNRWSYPTKCTSTSSFLWSTLSTSARYHALVVSTASTFIPAVKRAIRSVGTSFEYASYTMYLSVARCRLFLAVLTWDCRCCCVVRRVLMRVDATADAPTTTDALAA
eukprot:m.28928 g.28928  ORF g.28928 m.28928 type:complete len:634 (-) comp6616_c0_seq1:671-2572(-)